MSFANEAVLEVDSHGQPVFTDFCHCFPLKYRILISYRSSDRARKIAYPRELQSSA